MVFSRYFLRLFAVLCLFYSLSIEAQAAIFESEVRTFTSTDGKQLEAKLDNYNPSTGMVTIRVEGGKKYELPLSRFSEEDKAYCIEWRKDYNASFVRVNFFTNRIEGGRIVFMLDSSGSMRGERWDKMVRNMGDVIKRLDRGAEFNIVLFGSRASSFKPDLMTATKEVKDEAIRWLNSKQPDGSTNLLAAVKAASAMSKARVYAILSDGYPTGEVNQIYDTIESNAKNNGREIRVYTVSYYSESLGAEFLRSLSKQYNGSFVKR